MSEATPVKYSINLGFEEIRLPPFEDILVIGSKCPQGKIGLSKSFQFLIPNEFEVCEIENGTVEAVFINRRILKKIDKDKVISVLREKVFPYVSECEMLKVDFKLRISYETLEGDF